jgi:hypothetical protein
MLAKPFGELFGEISPFLRIKAAPASRRQYKAKNAVVCMAARQVRGRRESKNALKHGLYTKEAIEARKRLRELLRQSRKLIADIPR